MKQFFGVSQSGNLKEAVRGLHNPQMLLLMSNPGQFEQHVEELEKLFPQVPSIGCIGMSYDTRVVEKGVGVVAFCDGVKAAANVLEQVSSMPVKYIQRLQQDVRAVGASQRDTVCIDFCAGNDACALTTMISDVVDNSRIALTAVCGFFDKIKERYQEVVKHIDRASRLGTTKSAMFEDIDHMISQIPPIVKE